MATVQAQRTNKAKDVQTDADAASNVSQLKAQVVILAEAVERIEALLEQLVTERRRPV